MKTIMLLLATVVVGVMGFNTMPSQPLLSRTSVHGLRNQCHHHSASCSCCCSARPKTLMMSRDPGSPQPRNRGTRRRSRDCWGTKVEPRPKAQKPLSPPRSTSSSSASDMMRSRGGGGEIGPVKHMAILWEGVKRVVNAPVENYLLLVGDVCVLVGFRLLQDLVTTQTGIDTTGLDIEAYPDVIQSGMSMYAEPETAVQHVQKVIVEGSGLGLFWVIAVAMGRNKALSIRASLSQRLSAIVTVKTWIGAGQAYLLAMLMQACMLEQRLDLIDVSMELWWVLVVMLGWRALYTSQ